jgi:ring-1,2-phenylacetyl-CoA epoxidase subunit PaaD
VEKNTENILSILSQVNDPEIPVLSIVDLGILRKINIQGDEINISITPTYSGCPAMDWIGQEIKRTLEEQGYKNVKVSQVLSPAWTTDWMSEIGKEKLRTYGIAPPSSKSLVCDTQYFQRPEPTGCPLCHSMDTRLLSQFGSTPCKALYQCHACQEPFEYFKCH